MVEQTSMCNVYWLKLNIFSGHRQIDFLPFFYNITSNQFTGAWFIFQLIIEACVIFCCSCCTFGKLIESRISQNLKPERIQPYCRNATNSKCTIYPLWINKRRLLNAVNDLNVKQAERIRTIRSKSITYKIVQKYTYICVCGGKVYALLHDKIADWALKPNRTYVQLKLEKKNTHK